MIKHLTVLIFLFLITGCATSGGSGSPDGSASVRASLAETPVIFFQQYISGADGDRCAMTPSCSRYALNAIDRHGPVMGWIMAFDRMMRCGRDELTLKTPVAHRGRYYCPDAVSDNDFWWSKPE